MFSKKDFVTFVDSQQVFLCCQKKEEKKKKKQREFPARERERERDSLLSYGFKSCYLHERKPLARNSKSKPIIYPNHPRTCLMRVPPCHLLLANTSRRLKGDGKGGTKSISFTDHLYEIMHSERIFLSIIQVCKFERFDCKFINLSYQYYLLL